MRSWQGSDTEHIWNLWHCIITVSIQTRDRLSPTGNIFVIIVIFGHLQIWARCALVSKIIFKEVIIHRQVDFPLVKISQIIDFQTHFPQPKSFSLVLLLKMFLIKKACTIDFLSNDDWHLLRKWICPLGTFVTTKHLFNNKSKNFARIIWLFRIM